MRLFCRNPQLLGVDSAAVPEDIEALKKLVAELRQQLTDQHEQLLQAKKELAAAQVAAQVASPQRAPSKKGIDRSMRSSADLSAAAAAVPAPTRPAPNEVPQPKSSACVLL